VVAPENPILQHYGHLTAANQKSMGKGPGIDYTRYKAYQRLMEPDWRAQLIN
jgi:hypothetical protein